MFLNLTAGWPLTCPPPVYYTSMSGIILLNDFSFQIESYLIRAKDVFRSGRDVERQDFGIRIDRSFGIVVVAFARLISSHVSFFRNNERFFFDNFVWLDHFIPYTVLCKSNANEFR